MKNFEDYNLERKAKILGLRAIYREASMTASDENDEVAEILDDLNAIVEKLAEVALEAQSVVEEMGKEVHY